MWWGNTCAQCLQPQRSMSNLLIQPLLQAIIYYSPARIQPTYYRRSLFGNSNLDGSRILCLTLHLLQTFIRPPTSICTCLYLPNVEIAKIQKGKQPATGVVVCPFPATTSAISLISIGRLNWCPTKLKLQKIDRSNTNKHRPYKAIPACRHWPFHS